MQYEWEPLYRRIQRDITGRIAITLVEADCLARYASESDLHVEIGCLWGGTAALTALAGAQRVISIDKMSGGFWDTVDPAVNLQPSAGASLANLARLHAAHKVSIVNTLSDPWPLPYDWRPRTLFVDGDHSYSGVVTDWRNAMRFAGEYVLFHDYMPDHPGVVRAVDEVVKQTPGWFLIEQAGSITVFRRLA